MIKRLLAMALAITLTTAAAGQTFKLGDQAPALGGKVKWLKGEPVNEYKPGQVYVIDFWATWCAPCIESIPKINAMANEYRDKGVTVIGAAIWPQPDAEPTDEFVRAQGDAMNYVVAEDIDGRVARAYMAAAQLAGIPITMVINQEGRLAWMGHPEMDVESVLDQVLAGEYNLDEQVAHQAEIARGKEMLKEAEELAVRAGELDATGKSDESRALWDESFAIIDQIIAIDEKEFGWLGVMKFQFLLGRFGREEHGYAYGRHVVDAIIHENPVLLENVARFIVDGPGFTHRDYDLALKAITGADELTEHKEPAVLSTLALVRFAMGDAVAARDAITLAIELVQDERVKKDMQARLAEYEQAINKGG